MLVEKKVKEVYQDLRYSSPTILPRLLVNNFLEDVSYFFSEKHNIEIGKFIAVGFLVHLKYTQVQNNNNQSFVIDLFNHEIDNAGLMDNFVNYMNFVASSTMTAKKENIDLRTGYSFGFANYICHVIQDKLHELGEPKPTQFNYQFIAELGLIIVDMYEKWSNELGIKGPLFQKKKSIEFEPSSHTSNELPIGGWLNLFAFWLIIGIIVASYHTYDSLNLYLTTDYDSIEREYNNFTRNVIEQIDFYATATSIVSLVCILILNYLFFNKRKAFVNFYISVSVLVIFISFVDDLLVNMVELKYYETTIVATLTSLIWVTYLLKSKRVNNTFVRTSKKYKKIPKEKYGQLTRGL